MESKFNEEGRGVLFKAKITGPNLPNAVGTVTINGVKKRVAAWNHLGKDGVWFTSFVISDFKEKGEKPTAKPKEEPQQQSGALPF